MTCRHSIYREVYLRLRVSRKQGVELKFQTALIFKAAQCKSVGLYVLPLSFILSLFIIRQTVAKHA